MKARIKATGEILEILDIGVSGKYLYLSNGKKYSLNELEFLSETIDWQHYRIQAAIAAMQGMLANPAHHKVQVESGEPFGYFYAMNAIKCADVLIEELKKGGQDDNNVHNN